MTQSVGVAQDRRFSRVSTIQVKGSRERAESAGLVKLVMVDQQCVVQAMTRARLIARGPLLGVDWGPLVRYLRMADGHSALTALAMPAGRATLTRHYAIEDLGTERLHDLDTRHCRLTVTTLRSGALGEGVLVNSSDWWVAPQIPALVWPDRFSPEPYRFLVGKCEVEARCAGETTEFAELMGSLVVRRNYAVGDEFTANIELVSYSTDPLPDELFEPPGDYAEVSEKELNDAVIAHLMKRRFLP